MRKKINKRLKELRGSRSQAEIANHFRIKQPTWGRWESGENEPCIDDIMAIAVYFNVSTDWLLGMTDIRVSAPEEVSASGEPAQDVSYWRIRALTAEAALEESRLNNRELMRTLGNR